MREIEYLLITSKQTYVADSLKELQKKSKNKSGAIQHMKGLGEVNVGVLKDIAFNKDTRKLVQLTHSPKDKKEFLELVGGSTTYRKKLLGV